MALPSRTDCIVCPKCGEEKGEVMGKQMKVYVAGSSTGFDRIAVATFMLALQDAGVEVTLDWPALMNSSAPDADLSDETLSTRAGMIRDAIARADVVWLLVPSLPSKGSWVEFGYGLGLGKLTVVSGYMRSCLFTSLASATYSSHYEALDSIVERAKCLAGDVRYTGPDRARMDGAITRRDGGAHYVGQREYRKNLDQGPVEPRPATKTEKNDADEF
jgi:hypothetical protein